MRYVGRHRAPRPLLLRRPVVGGVAAAIVLAGPVLYATGNFSGGIQSGTPTEQIADGASVDTTSGSTAISTTDIVVPTDGSVISTSDPKSTVVTGPTAARNPVDSGNGSGVGAGSGSQTTEPAATKTTKKPSKTPTKKPTTTKKPTEPPDAPTPTTSPPPEPTETDPPATPDPTGEPVITPGGG